MFQPTMINPVNPVREQVVSRNEESGGIPALEISRYLTRSELAKINYMSDNASEDEKNAVLINAAKMVCRSALVTEHNIDAEKVEALVELLLEKPEAHPSNAFNADTVDHVRDYLLYAYKHVRTEIFTASMERYQTIHKLYVPVDKIDYFTVDELMSQLQNPEQEISLEEAELVFQKNPMMSFSIMYAMSTHQVYSTVPLPEFRTMMLPMSYQLWKSVILSDDKKNEKENDLGEVMTVGKTVKLGLKNHIVSK